MSHSKKESKVDTFETNPIEIILRNTFPNEYAAHQDAKKLFEAADKRLKEATKECERAKDAVASYFAGNSLNNRSLSVEQELQRDVRYAEFDVSAAREAYSNAKKAHTEALTNWSNLRTAWYQEAARAATQIPQQPTTPATHKPDVQSPSVQTQPVINPHSPTVTEHSPPSRKR